MTKRFDTVSCPISEMPQRHLTMSMFLTKEDLEKARSKQTYQDCRDHLVGRCDCENNTQCKFHAEYYLRAHRKPDPLLDRGCVLFDGSCDCKAPALQNCKKYVQFVHDEYHPR